MNDSLNAKAQQTPVSEALSTLTHRLERAHSLYTRLSGRLSYITCSNPCLKQGESPNEPASSALVMQIKALTKTTDELCEKIESDLDTIQI